MYHRFSLSPICPARNFPIQRNPTNVPAPAPAPAETTASTSSVALNSADTSTSIDISVPTAVEASSSSFVSSNQEQSDSHTSVVADSVVETEVPATIAPIKGSAPILFFFLQF
jgi:hypothetical protein